MKKLVLSSDWQKSRVSMSKMFDIDEKSHFRHSHKNNESIFSHFWHNHKIMWLIFINYDKSKTKFSQTQKKCDKIFSMSKIFNIVKILSYFYFDFWKK